LRISFGATWKLSASLKRGGAAQIVAARFPFFVSLAHVKDRLEQGDGVFESGLRNHRKSQIRSLHSQIRAAVWKTVVTWNYL
jgi:hypothetical protein